MNACELVDHIRSGPASLRLCTPLRFRPRRLHRYNPCDFNDLLKALRCSETIRNVFGLSRLTMGISEEQWVRLVKTIGSIKGLEYLTLNCTPGSHDFDPFHAVADAVKNAHSLVRLIASVNWRSPSFPRDPSGMFALAKALRQHTNLQEFTWLDSCSPGQLKAMNSAVDPVLRALPACPHLRKVSILTECGSADGMKNLLQLQSTTDLCVRLNTEHWLPVVDEIRLGRCHVVSLTLIVALEATRSEATEAVKALASAILLDQTLEHLTLEMEDVFTDEAGVALAEALTVNKHLRMITLPVAALGVEAYEAFSAMLRVNTSLVLMLPSFETAGADEKLHASRKQMVIEQRLNKAGRGRLMVSKETTREDYVDALHRLNTCNVDDSHAFRVSCLYSLLRLNPSVLCVSERGGSKRACLWRKPYARGAGEQFVKWWLVVAIFCTVWIAVRRVEVGG
jgi:hypothetical protein